MKPRTIEALALLIVALAAVAAYEISLRWAFT